jgi:hypothetical protein
MGEKYTLEWDHIFPFSSLRDNGYSWEQRHKYNLAQEITNRAILTQTANRKKSDNPAKEYLSEVRTRFKDVLKRQVIPEDERFWELDNYELFLAERRKMLANELNTYLEKLADMDDSDVRLSAEELIAEGESYRMEFKESLRWDGRRQIVNKELEAVVLKTIAAFGNTEGGILFIGVRDNGEVEGLELDYASLKDGDKDAFELHLLNLVSNEYGTEFAANGIKLSFPIVQDKEICMVEVRPSLRPLYTQTADKGGAKVQKFYVRRGNSSNELPLHEISNYISGRFANVKA